MSPYEQSIARIRAFAKSQKIRPARLAIMAGLHANTLRSFDDADWSPTGKTLRKLEALIPADFIEGEAA
jgi:3,4-dihydroxy 2-butanone 4-phosphate synthase/GTP cyclohydrolase II